MTLIGNNAGVMVPQGKLAVANFTSYQNPSIDTNPASMPVTWLNLTSGELFTCIDNTAGANKWVGTRGTSIGPVLINTPLINYPIDGSMFNHSPLYVQSTTFISTGASGGHYSSDWEIAEDSSFLTLVDSVYDSITSKNSVRFSALEVSTLYYLRTRQKTYTGGVSDWSPVVSFTTAITVAAEWSGKTPLPSAHAAPVSDVTQPDAIFARSYPSDSTKGLVMTADGGTIKLFTAIAGSPITYPSDAVTAAVGAYATSNENQGICFINDTTGVFWYSKDQWTGVCKVFTIDLVTDIISFSAEHQLGWASSSFSTTSICYVGYDSDLGLHLLGASCTSNGDSYALGISFDGSAIISGAKYLVTSVATSNRNTAIAVSDTSFAIFDSYIEALRVYNFSYLPSISLQLVQTLDFGTNSACGTAEAAIIAPDVIAVGYTRWDVDIGGVIQILEIIDGVLYSRNSIIVGNVVADFGNFGIAKLADGIFVISASAIDTDSDGKVKVYTVDGAYAVTESNFHEFSTDGSAEASVVGVSNSSFMSFSGHGSTTEKDYLYYTHPG